MIIVDFNCDTSGSPDSLEWHNWRALGIGASDAPVIASHHNLCAPADWMKGINDLFFTKVSIRGQKKMNWVMLRGRDNEHLARELFEAQSGILVAPMFGEMDDFRPIRASFDGLSMDFDVIFEAKCPSDSIHEMASQGHVVGYYKPQLCHQAMVAWGHPEQWSDSDHLICYGSYNYAKDELHIVEIKPSSLAKLGEQIFKHEKDFYTNLETMTPPVGGKGLFDIDDRVAPLLENKRVLGYKLEFIKDLIVGRARTGDSLTLHTLVTSKGRKSLDHVALMEDIEIPQNTIDQYTSPATGWVLTGRSVPYEDDDNAIDEPIEVLEARLIEIKEEFKDAEQAIDEIKSEVFEFVEALKVDKLDAPSFNIRRGSKRVSYSQLISSLNLPEDTIEKYTTIGDASFSLRKAKVSKPKQKAA